MPHSIQHIEFTSTRSAHLRVDFSHDDLPLERYLIAPAHASGQLFYAVLQNIFLTIDLIFSEIILPRWLMTYLRTIYLSKHTQFSLEQIQQGTDYTEKRVSPLPFVTITEDLDRSKAFEK